MTSPSVLMFPAALRPSDNPYNRILSDAVIQQGADVLNYKRFGMMQRADALHIHWLERLYTSGAGRRSPLFADLAFRNLYMTARRVRANNGKVVWTVHNLKPHEAPSGGFGAVLERWVPRIMSEVDVVIGMSQGAEATIRDALPGLEHAEVVTIPHPHYRGVLPQPEPRAQVRKALGVPDDAYLVSMIGYVRPYKGILNAVRAFISSQANDVYLLVAGNCPDASFAKEILDAGEESQRFKFVNALLPDQDVSSYYGASDLAFFNFRDVFNSGSVLTALSLDVPVLAPAKGALVETSGYVGSNWLQLFDGDMTSERFDSFIDDMRYRQRIGRADLDFCAPDEVARLHMSAYGFSPV